MFASRGAFAGRPRPIPSTVSTLREAVRAKFLTISGLSAVGDRIYYYSRPQGSALPAATYYLTGSSGVANLGGPGDLTTSAVRVSFWSRDALEAAQMAAVAQESLQNWRGPAGTLRIAGVFNLETLDLPEQPRNASGSPTYQVIISFDVIHRSS